MKSLKAEASTLLYGILFLFFFQLLADFIEAIYAFGLLGTSIPIEMASLVVLFSPLLLFAFPKRSPRWVRIVLAQGVLLSRVIEAMLDTRGRMIVSGIGVGCFLAFLPVLLSARRRERPDVSTLGLGVTIGLGLSVLLRVLGSGYDLSTRGGFQALGWGLAVIAGVLLFALPKLEQTRVGQETSAGDERPGIGRTIGLSLGLTSVWVLLYFCFTAPNVIARWTGASYALIVALVVGVLCVFALLWTLASLWPAPRMLAALNRKTVLVWNVLFVLALAGALLAHQIRFPQDPSAYPLFEPPVTALHRVPLWLTLILFPVLLVDWIYLVQELTDPRRSPRVLGASFSLSSLFLLVVVLGQVFTTVYDYIPVVGPTFRDRFWLVFAVPGVALTLSTLLIQQGTVERVSLAPKGRLFPAAMALLGLATLAGVALTAPRPAAPTGPQSSLRVCTYNVQQGYDESGAKNAAGQLELLRRVDADLIGLQESDTDRVAGGNADIVRYFADQLDMYSYYGPKTVPGTFGIAVLSRYPIENPRTFYMYSAAEQTATIVAQVRVGDRTFNVYVTHLGNGGPIVQQGAILKEVAGAEDVLLMGDFNFRPDTPQYRLTTAALDDAWLIKWPQGVDDQGRRFDRRIDHVFLSPGIAVRDAQYLTDPESDHPAMVVELEWP
ncbi:MAG: endonuclease/exonuclease/phosphatase family protein [Anaerolineae bacterium]|nr:endonuclease/exonuclease/phosphatase family protein [Anaerolineae bacterium]